MFYPLLIKQSENIYITFLLIRKSSTNFKWRKRHNRKLIDSLKRVPKTMLSVQSVNCRPCKFVQGVPKWHNIFSLHPHRVNKPPTVMTFFKFLMPEIRWQPINNRTGSVVLWALCVSVRDLQRPQCDTFYSLVQTGNSDGSCLKCYNHRQSTVKTSKKHSVCGWGAEGIRVYKCTFWGCTRWRCRHRRNDQNKSLCILDST